MFDCGGMAFSEAGFHGSIAIITLSVLGALSQRGTKTSMKDPIMIATYNQYEETIVVSISG
jgi:hypothetical protein